MVEFWIRIPGEMPQDDKVDLLKKNQNILDVFVLTKNDINIARKLGIKTIASKVDSEIRFLSGNIEKQQINRIDKLTAIQLTVKDINDEERAIEAVNRGINYLIIDCPNWKIIPLENLIAKLKSKTGKLIASVDSSEEAKIAVETLELGVDGILLNNINQNEISNTFNVIKKPSSRIKLVEAEIVDTKILSLGARVCVDTCNMMKSGEGFLVGSQSSGLFLIQAEVLVNPHVEPRPFRVNAGPVSSYILKPDEKTQYLSELKAGDEVLIVHRDGKTNKGNIGRIKIEMRPQILIEAEYENRIFKVVLQNAETIHIVTPDSSISVVDLKKGDKVLIRHEEGGRHFGMLVPEEMVIEK